MKQKIKKMTVLLLTVILLFSCSEKNLQFEDVNLITQEFPVNSDNETFVSSKQAIEIAEKFFSKEGSVKKSIGKCLGRNGKGCRKQQQRCNVCC